MKYGSSIFRTLIFDIQQLWSTIEENEQSASSILSLDNRQDGDPRIANSICHLYLMDKLSIELYDEVNCHFLLFCCHIGSIKINWQLVRIWVPFFHSSDIFPIYPPTQIHTFLSLMRKQTSKYQQKIKSNKVNYNGKKDNNIVKVNTQKPHRDTSMDIFTHTSVLLKTQLLKPWTHKAKKIKLNLKANKCPD